MLENYIQTVLDQFESSCKSSSIIIQPRAGTTQGFGVQCFDIKQEEEGEKQQQRDNQIQHIRRICNEYRKDALIR